MSRDEVIRYINSNGDKIVMSSARNQRGERLYTLRSRRRNGSIINRIFAAMKNRGD